MIALLHGNGLCADFYASLCTELSSRGHRCSAIDLPGFAGQPSPSPRSWSGLLDTVEPAVRDALGDRGVLVGHSLGGLVALLLAPRLPLRAMVLLEPALIPWPWLARIGARLYARQVFTDRPPTFSNRGPWFWRLHDPASFPPDPMQLVLATGAQTDRHLVAALQEQLPSLYPLPFDRVSVPTLVVRGGSSGPVMALGQRDLLRRLPDATGAVIPQAGHWLANEQDSLLAAAIDDFLRERC